jgi:DNA repair protein RadA/Sms
MTDPSKVRYVDPLVETARVIDFLRERKLRAPTHGMRFRAFDTIPDSQLRWLWSGRIPFGLLSIIEGMPGEGKTTLVTEIAARLSRGEALPGHQEPVDPMHVLWFTTEESASTIIKPRLAKAGADLSRIHEIEFDPERPDSWLSFPSRAKAFEDSVRDAQISGLNVGLLVIDGLSAVLDRKLSAHVEQDVRWALGTLAKIIERLNITCIGIRHPSKSNSGPALLRGGGSIGFAAVARSVWLVGKDPADPAKRIFANVKPSLSRAPRSLRFELVDRGDFGGVKWLDDCDVTADEVYAANEPQRPRRATKQDIGMAKDSIMEALRDLGRGVLDAELMRQLEASAGVTRDAYIRAKQQLLSERAIRSSQAADGWHVELRTHSAPRASRAPDEVF